MFCFKLLWPAVIGIIIPDAFCLLLLSWPPLSDLQTVIIAVIILLMQVGIGSVLGICLSLYLCS